MDNYLGFMDNLYLFCLMSDHYTYITAITCLIASIVFFISKNDSTRVDKSYYFITFIIKNNKAEVNKIELHKDFVCKSLLALGTRSEDIGILRERIQVSSVSY